MNRFSRLIVLMGLAAVMLVPATGARAVGDYPREFGDYPNDYFVPGIDVGCWRWNWYQHAYYNVCPVYPFPKAIMYPRRVPAVGSPVIGAKG